MNVLDAAKAVIDGQPGGRESFAPRINCSPEVLRKKLAAAPGFKLGAVELATIVGLCADSDDVIEIFNALARETTRVQVNLVVPKGEGACGKSPLQRVSDLMRETSDVTTTVINAMADGVVTDNELERIEQEIAEAEAVLQRLRQCARVVNAAGKPASARTPEQQQIVREFVGVAA